MLVLWARWLRPQAWPALPGGAPVVSRVRVAMRVTVLRYGFRRSRTRRATTFTIDTGRGHEITGRASVEGDLLPDQHG